MNGGRGHAVKKPLVGVGSVYKIYQRGGRRAFCFLNGGREKKKKIKLNDEEKKEDYSQTSLSSGKKPEKGAPVG